MPTEERPEPAPTSEPVLHPEPSPSSGLEPPPSKEARGRGLLFNLFVHLLFIVVGFALIFYHLGTPSLFEPSEGRYASVARTMVETGDYARPQFNGLYHFSKPPLTYWLCALGMKHLGFNELGARIMLPLAAVFTILGCYHLGILLLTPRAAICAGFVLLTSLFFNVQFRGLTTDPLLTMFETWMIWAFFAFELKRKRRYRTLFWLFAALGMLTKGPPALLPLLGLLPALGYYQGRDRLRALLVDPLGWVLFALIGCGWYVWLAASVPGVWQYFLYDETIARVASTHHDRSGPWHYFIWILVFGTFPWSLFFLGGLFQANNEFRRQGLPARSFLLIWTLVPLLVFTLSRSKLAAYALPLLIPASLLVGAALSRFLRFDEDESVVSTVEAALPVVVVALLGLGGIYASWAGLVPDPKLARLLLYLSGYFLFLCVFGYFFLAYHLTKGIALMLGVVVPGMMIILLPGVHGGEEIGPKQHLPGYRAFLQTLGQLPPETPLLFVEDMLQAAPFYTGRTIATWNVTRESRFNPGASGTLVLNGDEALRERVRRENPLLIIRHKDVARIETLLGRKVESRVAQGKWALAAIGLSFSQRAPTGELPVVTGAASPSTAAAPGEADSDGTLAHDTPLPIDHHASGTTDHTEEGVSSPGPALPQEDLTGSAPSEEAASPASALAPATNTPSL